MSDALPDDAWIQNFLSAPPRPLQQALQKRLHASTAHLNSLAELYKQRAVIEAQYAESLAKLVRSAEQGSMLPKTSIEWDKSSGEGKLWDTIINELSETSTSHSTLAALLRTDFEQPLRDLPNKIVAWRRIGDQDASLEKTLKDYEKTSAKLEKASTKAKSSKTDVLASELNSITSSLASLSPMMYTTYQRLDEERLRSLKEIIVRWGTVRADIAQRDSERAERAVALLISWETQDEVLAVGRKLGGGGGGGGVARSSNAVTAPSLSSVSTTPQFDRRSSSFANSPSNDFSPRPTPRQNGSSNNLLAPQTNSFATGIKSMLGRRPTLGPGRGRSGSNATSTLSGRDRDGGFASIGEDTPRRDSTAPPVDEEGYSVAPADRHRSLWDEPDTSDSGLAAPIPPSAPPTGSAGNQNITASPSGSTEELASSASSQQPGTQPKLNLALAPAPIQESEDERLAALQKMQQTLQMQPPQQPSRRQTIARGRRDVRNTVFGNIGESSSSGPSPKATSPISESGDLGVSSPFPMINAQPANVARTSPSDRQASLSSVSSNPFESVNLTNGLPPAFASNDGTPGLRANIVETVSAITRAGDVQRVQINGEIHLSLRLSPDSPSAQGPIHIRMSEFENLEKIAPNPAYLAQVPDKPGEYFLNAEVLASATTPSNSRGTLLFRYQVHVAPGHESSFLPLILEPAFRCGDGETRMILNYRRNTSTWSSNGNLSNVSLVAAFGAGPSVSNVQAKPAGGVWAPLSRRMTWNLGEVPNDGKVIAKFVSEPGSPLAPQGVQASWAMEGVLASGIGLSVVRGDLEAGLDLVQVEKAVTTGKYLAEAVTQ